MRPPVMAMDLLERIGVVVAICLVLAAREVATELSRFYFYVLGSACILPLLFYWMYTLYKRNPGRMSSFSSPQPSGPSKVTIETNPTRTSCISSPRPSGPSHVTVDPLKVKNDSLYELHKPPNTPTMQILFFHGLQVKDSADIHLSTWKSGDCSCIWPETWLRDEFPGAHILAVSYSGNPRKGGIDMHAIVENLISDLMEQNIGQTRCCPVILVGHSFGGLVIKRLCVQVNDTLVLRKKYDRERVKLEKFLASVKGIYYYATPHHGSRRIDELADKFNSPLLKYFRTLSTETAWLNFRFQLLRRLYPSMRIHGLGETMSARKGLFRGVVGVEEPSARDGDCFNCVKADHIGICRPMTKATRSFYGLRDLIKSIMADIPREARIREEARRQDEKWAQETQSRNFLHLLRRDEKWAPEESQSVDVLHLLRQLGAADNAQMHKTITEPSSSISVVRELAYSIAMGVQLNDSLYQLHNISGTPTMQVVFFHGLQPGDYRDAHFLAWQSEDGSCIWPNTWLPYKYPGAQILYVSYPECLVTNNFFDMYLLIENLLSDLLQGQIGQFSNCPIVLVAHSFGGLIVKLLCLRAYNRHKQGAFSGGKLEKLLANICGICYFGTPHFGSPVLDFVLRDAPLGRLWKTVSNEAARLRDEFDHLLGMGLNYDLRIAGLGESVATKLDFFTSYTVVVPEASARYGYAFNIAEGADHFQICRPKGTKDRRFGVLTELLDHVVTDSQDKILAESMKNLKAEWYHVTKKGQSKVQWSKSKRGAERGQTPHSKEKGNFSGWQEMVEKEEMSDYQGNFQRWGPGTGENRNVPKGISKPPKEVVQGSEKNGPAT